MPTISRTILEDDREKITYVDGPAEFTKLCASEQAAKDDLLALGITPINLKGVFPTHTQQIAVTLDVEKLRQLGFQETPPR